MSNEFDNENNEFLSIFLGKCFYKKLDNVTLETGLYLPCEDCYDKKCGECSGSEDEQENCDGCNCLWIISPEETFVIYEDDTGYKINYWKHE